MSPDTFTLLAINIAPLRPLDMGTQEVLSGIFKTPQDGGIELRRDGLAGDRIGDTAHHGGPDQAVHLYGQPDIEHWNSAAGGLAGACQPGFLGENLTLQGLTEADIHVGDRLRFPDCVLRVTEARQPCDKLVHIMGYAQAARDMVQHERCGWYLAVEHTGTLCAGQHAQLEPGPRQTPVASLLRRHRHL